MTTKLTLTIEDSVIISAKKYARQEGRSLSGMVENYLNLIVVQEVNIEGLSPKVARLKGVIKLPEDFDYKTALGDGLTENMTGPVIILDKSLTY